MCLESACLHCLQGMGFPFPQILPTGCILSYSLFVHIFVLSSSMYFELCQFSEFHCGFFFKFKMAARIKHYGIFIHSLNGSCVFGSLTVMRFRLGFRTNGTNSSGAVLAITQISWY